ncbi:MAG: hypothetical protein COS89_06690 [Deltaproteobacteria bacterium CG07_land_8_20_14_0_80_38_7]|nr:MAG: hypothetical protein COS89_06690 [Deltaproteobacteria bacterium CG07_land_8_20_14_0_80_38_7]
MSPSIIEWIKSIPEKDWKPLQKITDKGSVDTDKEWTEMSWTSANGSQADIREWNLQRVCDHRHTFDTLQHELDCYENACAGLNSNGEGSGSTPFLYNGVCYTDSSMVPIAYDNDGSIEARELTPRETRLHEASWDFRGDDEGFDIYSAIECTSAGICYMGYYTDTSHRGGELKNEVMCIWAGQPMPVEE